MENNAMNNRVVPENITGKAVNLEQTVTEQNNEEAVAAFKRACKRLMNPGIWQDLSGSALAASFQLADGHQSDPHRLLQLNDYLKIDIPGPGPGAGDGYDWVQVKELAEDIDPAADQSFGLMLAASVNPGKPEEGAAHFFKEGASSSFVFKRKGNTVTAFYYGRNEKPNTDNEKMKDNLRNSMVAAGALAGLSELQWTALIRGLLRKEIGD